MPHPNLMSRPALELQQVDRACGRARRYHVAESRSLFGELALLITWGRIGSKPRVRLETFASESELSARWNELLARRNAHGYVARPCS
jgi:predicted DNA-binding WGR domain protein